MCGGTAGTSSGALNTAPEVPAAAPASEPSLFEETAAEPVEVPATFSSLGVGGSSRLGESLAGVDEDDGNGADGAAAAADGVAEEGEGLVSLARN